MKILLVALEGFTAAAYEEARSRGKLPALDAVAAAGSRSDLRFPLADARVAMLVSAMTGTWPDQHGILLGQSGDPVARLLHPIRDSDRAQPALWEPLDAHGIACLSVGWPVAITGRTEHSAIVAAGFGHAPATAADGPPDPTGFIHPPTLAATLADCWLHPREIDPATITALVPGWAQLDLAVDSRPGLVGAVLAENVSRHAAFLELMGLRPWTFATLCLSLPGEFASLERSSHTMGDGLLDGLAERGLPLLDAFLAAILTRLPADTNVVIVGIPHAETPNAPGFVLTDGPAFDVADFPGNLKLTELAPLIWNAAGFGSNSLRKGIKKDYPQRPFEFPWLAHADHRPDQHGRLVATAAYFQKMPDQRLLPGESWQLKSLSILGRSLLARGEPLVALPVLETQARMVPLSQSAQLLFSECLQKLGLLEAALDAAYAAIHPTHGNHPAGLLRAAELEVLTGRPDQARKLLKEAGPALKDFPQYHLQQANILIFLRDWTEAEVILERLAREAPNDGYVRYRLARCHLARRNWYAAFDQAMESLRLDFSQALSRELLGHALLGLGMLEQAGTAFQLAAEADPLWPRPRAMLVTLTRRINKSPEQLEIYRAAYQQAKLASEQRRESLAETGRALIKSSGATPLQAHDSGNHLTAPADLTTEESPYKS